MFNLASFTTAFDKSDIYIVCLTVLITYFIFRNKTGLATLNWDHWWQNLDKFLVSFMFGFVFIVAVKQAGQIWIQDLVKQLLPAVLALLGARAWTNRSNGNGNGNGSDPNAITTTTTQQSASTATQTTSTPIVEGVPVVVTPVVATTVPPVV